MKPFSEQLLKKLKGTRVSPASTRPRILLGADEAADVRERAHATPGFVDRLAQQAEAAAKDEVLFGEKPEIPYFARAPISPLSYAAFLLEDDRFAQRALEGMEALFSFPAEEWVARPHRPMRCDHAMLNVAASVGVALDLCAPFLPADAVRSVSERLHAYTAARFLETWEKQDAHWAQPDYKWNWKIMCCGEMGVAALACAEAFPDLEAVLSASLEGVLDILDCVPEEGDWPEGIGYWFHTLAFGLRLGWALRYASKGAVDLFGHPALKVTGDYVVHVTEPDGMVYDFNDNGISLGATLDYLSLLARVNRRKDWAWTARMSDHVTLERLAWDDPSLESALPAAADTARRFSWTGLATMRSGWDANATFVGFKSGPSDVAHSHLDANSFVMTARNRRLLVDEGTWPYAHFLGFFDMERRFNFDNNGAVGHNTLLVDGQGQVYGPEYPGQITAFQAGADVDVVTGDATKAYGGKLSRFLRTLTFVKPDLLLVYDRVAADEPRVLEWMFHHRGMVEGDEVRTRFVRDGATLTLCRVLPEQAECWRTNDVVRTSSYTNSNTLRPERVNVRYRSFGPFHPCEEMEVLWALYAGDPAAVPEVTASVEGDRLKVETVFSDGRRWAGDLERTGGR